MLFNAYQQLLRKLLTNCGLAVADLRRGRSTIVVVRIDVLMAIESSPSVLCLGDFNCGVGSQGQKSAAQDSATTQISGEAELGRFRCLSAV
jgi:hypothetical protein